MYTVGANDIYICIYIYFLNSSSQIPPRRLFTDFSQSHVAFKMIITVIILVFDFNESIVDDVNISTLVR